MKQRTEEMLVSAIDEVLAHQSGPGVVDRTELVDVLLDLRSTVREIAVLRSLEPLSTPELSARSS